MVQKVTGLYLSCLVKEEKVLTFVRDYLRDNNLDMSVSANRCCGVMEDKCVAVFGLNEDKSIELYSLLKSQNFSDKMKYEMSCR